MLILISLTFAPLGCIVLWKRYAYFGDGLAHASLLAGSISCITNILPIYSGLLVSIIFVLLVFKFKNSTQNNAIINIVASFMLSISIVLLSINQSRININQLLFGDIIATSNYDVLALTIMFVVTVLFIKTFLNKIILIVLNRDIATIQGVNCILIEFVFLILLGIAVFSAIKIVGTLLVTSILLIPAMTARLISKNPFQMVLIAPSIALVGNFLGFISSFYLDLPISPMIVIIGVLLYIILHELKMIYTR